MTTETPPRDTLTPEFAPTNPPEAPSPAKPTGLAASFGAGALELVTGARDLYSVFVRTLYWTAVGKKDWRAVFRYANEFGNNSVFFLSVTMGFIGMIMVFQSALQALRVVPDLTLLGATYLELLVRDLAASIGALMLATRVGAGSAAEIGSMVVTEQVDALRMCGFDPVDYLVVPRFLASLITTTALIVWAGFVSFAAGMLTAWFSFGVTPETFVNVHMVTWGDVIIGVTKTIAYGAAIPVVSGHCGLSTFGGSEGVGWATTRAVVNSSLAVIILNFFISGAGFVLFPP